MYNVHIYIISIHVFMYTRSFTNLLLHKNLTKHIYLYKYILIHTGTHEHISNKKLLIYQYILIFYYQLYVETIRFVRRIQTY